MRRNKENHQCTSAGDKYAPRTFPDPPPPPMPPNKPVQQQYKSPSIGLEGKKRILVGFDNRPTRDMSDMLGASKHDKDVRNWPKKN